MANSYFIKSSLVKKYWMAASGLFLCVFLLGHLAGNLQLLLPKEQAQEAFNAYALFMTTFPLVKILSYLTYASIIFHAIDGIFLTYQNIKARPVGYVHTKTQANSIWTSRNMGILGTAILVFLVFHMYAFWAGMHFREMPMYTLQDGTVVKDLYLQVYNAFKSLPYVLFYVVSMIPLGLHLSHGFTSGFQTLGVNHPKFNKLIQLLGLGFSIFVPLLFAVIPVYMYIFL